MPDEPRSFPSPYSSAYVAGEGRVPSGEIPGLASTISGPDWPRAVAAVHRFRWLVATLTLVGAAAGILASGTIETEFRAETTIAVDTASADDSILGPINPSALLEAENWNQVLDSYRLLEGEADDSGASDTAVGPADPAARFDAVVDRDAGLVQLGFRNGNAERAASVLNAATRRLVDLELELKRETRQGVARDLSERIRFASEHLEQSGAALAETRRVIRESPRDLEAQVALQSAIERDTAAASFFDRRVELEQVTRDREDLDNILQSTADSSLRLGAVELIAATRGAGELLGVIEELRGKRVELRVLRAHGFDDRHPRVRRLQAELAALEDPEAPRLTWVLFRMLRARESEMYRELTAAPADLKAVPRRVVERERLERHIEAVVRYSQALQERQQRTEAAVESAVPALRVISVAEAPGWPASRTRKLNLILLSVLGCLAIGAAGAVVLDRLDPLVHDPGRVGRELGVAVLGTVPRLPLRDRERRSLAVEPMMDSFGRICQNLSYQHGREGSLLVAVNSFAPRDGKTLVVCNMALAFAHQGRQTVLVDAAGRRSTLHARLDCQRGPGLTDYLAGQASWDEILQLTKYDAVDLVARGNRSAAGLKPIPSASMTGLLNVLRTIYDVVLVEGLPLSYGRGALALGRLAGNMLLVLRADATDLEMLESKLDLIEPMQIRVVGAVLNRVPPH